MVIARFVWHFWKIVVASWLGAFLKNLRLFFDWNVMAGLPRGKSKQSSVYGWDHELAQWKQPRGNSKQRPVALRSRACSMETVSRKQQTETSIADITSSLKGNSLEEIANGDQCRWDHELAQWKQPRRNSKQSHLPLRSSFCSMATASRKQQPGTYWIYTSVELYLEMLRRSYCNAWQSLSNNNCSSKFISCLHYLLIERLVINLLIKTIKRCTHLKSKYYMASSRPRVSLNAMKLLKSILNAIV